MSSLYRDRTDGSNIHVAGNMAGILQTFLAHLSSDQLLDLLSRYLGTPESNRDSDFYLCLKSVLITLKEQDKLLDDLVCRVTHELCLPVVRCGDLHDNRQKYTSYTKSQHCVVRLLQEIWSRKLFVYV